MSGPKGRLNVRPKGQVECQAKREGSISGQKGRFNVRPEGQVDSQPKGQVGC